MENPINWGLKLSLEEMSLRRVAANLWTDYEILCAIDVCRLQSLSKVFINIWRATVESKVKDKVSNLVLPESLKKQIMHLIRPMGSDILKWKAFHEKILCCSSEHFDIRIFEQLCWSWAGAIHYRNTAERLIRHKILNIENRYKLACIYCLIDYIADLWEQLPECTQKIFYYKGYSSEVKLKYSSEVKILDMRCYWAFILNEKESKLNHVLGRDLLPSFCQYASFKGNKAAAEYFLQQIPHKERDFYACKAVNSIFTNLDYIDPSYIYCTSDFPIADVISYLLAYMTREQQMQVLKKFPYDVLKCFVDWPWQDLFLDLVDIVWTFIPETGYDSLLFLIIVSFRSSGYYFPNFFQQFFLRSHINFKKHFICRYKSFFSAFFNAEDTETIQVIFRSIDVEDRMKLISGYNFFELLDGLVMKGKWHLVKLCIQEATLSKEDMKKLKENFMGFVSGIDSRRKRLRKRKWRMFFQFLDKAEKGSLNKRKYEGEILTRAKKTFLRERKIFH